MENIKQRDIQREFFSIIDELFTRTMGENYETFMQKGDFGDQVRKNAREIASRIDELLRGYESLQKFYIKSKVDLFTEAKSLGGMKLVMGGGSRFLKSQLDGVRKILLYADTILIPDPILPWLERDRAEEKFRDVLMLENIFYLLQLKPLVDADLPYPAIVVFQSWEKSLEDQDFTTQEGILNLYTNFMSYYLEEAFASPSDILEYANKFEEQFISKIGAKQLFIAPGGNINDSPDDAMRRYRDEIKIWRSSKHSKSVGQRNPGALVLQAILERIVPQYHLLENAYELKANPMLALPAQWHYYKLCAGLYENELLQHGNLKSNTVSIIQAINNPEFRWLGNVPIKVLLELRKNNENEDFRHTIEKYTNVLSQTTIDDLDAVANEVGRGINRLLSDHQKRIGEIGTKYSRLYAQTAIGGWVTLAATFIPALAPIVGTVTPVALAGKYAWDKFHEHEEKKKLSKSLMGVLASAHEYY